MRKLFVILLIIIGTNVIAQQYNNEWIDYNKTYYKFKVGTTGLYRINQSVLTSLTTASGNLSTIPAEQFQVWRNGKQIPIYTSSITGTLPANGYIEFWGERNDGVADNVLYRKPTYQQSDKISLQTDTASFFLTVEPSVSQNLRYADQANPSSSLTPEPYFMHPLRFDFREQINHGFYQSLELRLYSSSYDQGEFFSTYDILYDAPKTVTADNLFVATTSGQLATLSAGVAGSSSNGRTVNVVINNSAPSISQSLGPQDAAIFTATVSTSILNTTAANSFKISTTISAGDSVNRIVCSFLELKYPRQFNFGGATSFPFTLPANASGNYLEITNFNQTATPVLYDITNRKRYTAIVTGTTLKFSLQPSSIERNLVLVNPSVVSNITTFVKRNFINYATTNQGNYLIISNKILGLNNGGSVEKYMQYRASSVGGGFNAKVYDIDDLTDQFAFGIKRHPLSVKNFVRFAKANFTSTPTHAFLIGKGADYENYRYNESDPLMDTLDLVPTFGWPASDALLVSPGIEAYPSLSVGRLSVITQQEVLDYLDKVKQYESTTTNPTIADQAWKKEVVHLAGGNSVGEGSYFRSVLESIGTIIKDTLFGANITPFSKLSSASVATVSDALMKQKFESGISLFTYYGHSSATTLEYNVSNPYSFNSAGKYPMFLINGCDAGNFFEFKASRKLSITALAEIIVLAKDRGGIGFIGSTHFGVTGTLDRYSAGFYSSLTGAGYGKDVGRHMNDAILNLQPFTGDLGNNFISRIHAEQFLLHGDPAIKIYNTPKPDFAVEAPDVLISPSLISVADGKFKIRVNFRNLGRATRQGNGDSVAVLITRKYPDNTSDTIYNKFIKPAIRNYDSTVNFEVAINAAKDKGTNTITVFIDSKKQFDELDENNNIITKTFAILDNDMRPVYPYNYAIIDKNTSKLFASTANPLMASSQYMMEMDTTELFNSSSKISKTVTSIGGAVEFDPQITYKDSTVYYWRVAPVPLTGLPMWNKSSFVYLASGGTGFNQSHLYQHFKSTFQGLNLDSTTRRMGFGKAFTKFDFKQSNFGITNQDQDLSIAINGALVVQSACIGKSIIFSVFDSVTMKPLVNQAVPSVTPTDTAGGFMGSAAFCGAANRMYNFEFDMQTEAGRHAMVNFMNWIPNNYIVGVRSNLDQVNGAFTNNPFVNVWKADAAPNLYTAFKNVGFNDIDSFNRPRTFVFIYKKNNSTQFAPQWAFSTDTLDAAIMSALVPSSDTIGYIGSPSFGPAKTWKQLKWRGSSLEASSADIATVYVMGVKTDGSVDTLYTVNKTQQDVDLTGVNAKIYPYIKLGMFNEDTQDFTPYQLRYWRLLAEMVPEGAIAPNVKYNFASSDTLDAGALINFSVAFKNVSDVSFGDSIRVKVHLIDQSNVSHLITDVKLKKPLIAGDTTTLNATIDTKNYVGNNILFVDWNPELEQPEQYAFNNTLYKSFYVKGDKVNPLMDVTFDGVHILNGDIVSSKPAIKIKLKDESKFLALNDTAGVKIQLRDPDGNLRSYKFGTDTLKFTPPTNPLTDNSAIVDFTPVLETDGEYQLVVAGSDRTGNETGSNSYNVDFSVYNKPMISDMFNYPNPFTTSTAFVFTLTGSQIPSNIRIQILTITGKVIKEINKDELGPLHIGRNITEYKWNGTDQYGQKVGNGVYLYRVITNLNGNKLDNFQLKDRDGSNVDTNKYFKGGYGKMYLMR